MNMHGAAPLSVDGLFKEHPELSALDLGSSDVAQVALSVADVLRQPVSYMSDGERCIAEPGRVEFVIPGLTRAHGGITQARINAAIDSFMSMKEEADAIEICQRASRIASDHGMGFVTAEISSGYLAVHIAQTVEDLVRGDVRVFSSALEQAFPSHLIEIQLSEVGADTLAHMHNQLKESECIYTPPCSTLFGFAEVEMHARALLKKIRTVEPVAILEIGDESVMISSPGGERLNWIKAHIGANLSFFPVPVHVQEIGFNDDSMTRLEVPSLIRFALPRTKVRMSRGDKVEVRDPFGAKPDVKEITQSLQRITGLALHIEGIHTPDDERVKRVIPHYVRPGMRENLINGKIVAPLSSVHPAHDIRPEHFVRHWELSKVNSGTKLVALDEANAASDVAFGIKKRSNGGGYLLEAAIVNVARINIIGGDLDEITVQRNRSRGKLGLYPSGLRHRYIGLSTTLNRPLFYCTISLDSNFNPYEFSLTEKMGSIHYKMTPQEFLESEDPYIKIQRELHMTVGGGIYDKFFKKMAFVMQSEEDNMLSALHHLLYEQVGNWMRRQGDIYVTDQPMRSGFNKLKIGHAVVEDRSRWFQHQLMAALGSAEPLSEKEMMRRLSVHEAVKNETEEDRLAFDREVVERSQFIGREVLAEVVTCQSGVCSVKFRGEPAEFRILGGGNIKPGNHAFRIHALCPERLYYDVSYMTPS